MNILAKTALSLSVLAVLFCLVEYTIPATKAHFAEAAELRACELNGWITDTCVERPDFWERVQ